MMLVVALTYHTLITYEILNQMLNNLSLLV